MAQYAPYPMEWSERALLVRQFVFDYWAEKRRGHGRRPKLPELRHPEDPALLGRRGVYFAMEQVRDYVEPAVGIRGWDYDWPSQSMNPEGLINPLVALGVDLSPWEL